MPGGLLQMQEMRSGSETIFLLFVVLHASYFHSCQTVSVLCCGSRFPPALFPSSPARLSNHLETLRNHTRRPYLHYFAKPASRGGTRPCFNIRQWKAQLKGLSKNRLWSHFLPHLVSFLFIKLFSCTSELLWQAAEAESWDFWPRYVWKVGLQRWKMARYCIHCIQTAWNLTEFC